VPLCVNVSKIASRLTLPIGAVAVAAATVGAVLCSSTVADARSASSADPAARAGTVSVMGMMFMPGTVSTTLGGSVTWTNDDSLAHTVTSDQRLWDSGTKAPGATYVRTFTSAGSFAYHCAIHPEMRGKVSVPLTASGSAAKGYKLTWATVKGAGGVTYDVQTRLGSGRWVPLKAATAGTHAKFNPAASGKYSVRARTGKGSARSGWSPTVSVTIS
jgi:plastocyanin